MAGAGLGREYWKLWAANASSSLGEGMRLTALPLLAADHTRNAALIGGLAAAGTVPWLAFGLLSGAVVDRLDRRRILVFGNVFRTGVFVLLGVAVLLDWTSLALLYAVSLVVGSAETLIDTAAPAIVPALVAPERFQEANARLSVARTSAHEFAGPPLGGLLFGLAAASAFLGNAGAFAVAALILLALRGSFRVQGRPAAGLLSSVGEGVAWLWRHRLLRTLSLLGALLALVDAAWFSILVLFSLEVLDVQGVAFGALVASGAAGSAAGGLAARRASRRIGPGTTLILAVLVAAAAQAAIGLTSNPYVAGVMLAVSGGAWTLWNVLVVSLRQALVPDRLLGRANSAYLFLGFGATTIGAVLGGVVAHAAGLRAPFLIGAPVLVVLAAAAAPAMGNRAIATAHAEAAT